MICIGDVTGVTHKWINSSTDHGGGKRRAGNSAVPILFGLALNCRRIRIFYFQPKRRAAPAVNRAELLGDNTFTAEPASFAKYNRAVLLVMLVEYDARV
jgi:hypothetical protein